MKNWVQLPDWSNSATVNGSGVATITYQSPTPADVRLTQISVSIPGTTIGIAQVTLNGIFVVGTAAGWADTSAGDPPIYVARGDQLKIIWTGATVGATAYVYIVGEQAGT